MESNPWSGLSKWDLGTLNKLQTVAYGESDSDKNKLIHAIQEHDYGIVRSLIHEIYRETRNFENLEELAIHLQILSLFADVDGIPVYQITYVENSISWLSDIFNYDSANDELLLLSLMFLSMLCYHTDKSNTEFIDEVAKLIEPVLALAISRADTEDDKTMTFACLRCLFGMNKFYPAVISYNPVLTLLSERSTQSKHLGTEIIRLFNQGFMDHVGFDPFAKDLCLKFLNDLFTNSATSNLFYINDQKILIDIFLREIRNCEPTDMTKVKLLVILYRLLMNCTDYCIHVHRGKEILELAKSHAQQTDALGQVEEKCKEVCANILSHCSSLLSSSPMEFEDI